MRVTKEFVDGLRAVREAIAIDEGRSFDMGQWSEKSGCGTTCCIAGHLALMRGWTPIPSFATGGAYFNKGNLRPIMEPTPIHSVILNEFGFDMDLQYVSLFYVGSASVETIFGNWLNEGWQDLFDMYHRGWKVKAAQLAIDRWIAKYAPQFASEQENGLRLGGKRECLHNVS